MKRLLSLLISAIITFSFIAVFTSYAESSEPSRQINVVFDDSGSMIRNVETKELVDTWCQAKYAMEVFAAMLGDNDTMNVYAMSDFDNTEKASPKLHLDGSDGMSSNVSQVHNMVTYALNTPFNTVRKAYKDLLNNSADEKWLVVLTDGKFQGINDINNYFKEKSQDVNVIFLGMGAEAESNNVVSDEKNNVFAVYAKNNTEILSKITGICTRIFNSQRLAINPSTKKISFDIPMGELIVFAQGAKVQINGIKGENGKTFESSNEPVTVKYSDKATTNGSYTEFKIDKGLLGSLATFTDDFVAGSYTLDVTGAETIEVYYKPNIEIAAYLTDSKGNKIPDLSQLEAGEYTINFGLVKGGTTEPVEQSSLLGDVEYTATVENNGNIHEQNYHDGDKISLVEGNLTIDAVATYLDYNTTSTQIKNQIFKNKEVTFEMFDDQTFAINDTGIDNKKPMKVKVKFDGKDITEDQWNKMDIPKVKLAEHTGFKLDDFKVEKSNDIGVFNITPFLKGDKPSSVTYEDCDLEISYEGTSGAEKWSGKSNIKMKFSDNRSWFERNKRLVIELIILAVILFIALGYTPLFKHYLPRGLKKAPAITVRSSNPLEGTKNRSGKLSKNLMSTIIPYKSQTGSIKFVPPSVPGVLNLKVRGIKGGRMEIVNLDSYRNNPDIKFRGQNIVNQKKFESGAGLVINVTKKGYTYICQTNKNK